jgi:hypothetical protein
MADPQSPPFPEARFTNVATVRHTPAEFYLQFGQLMPDRPGVAAFIASVVLTPQHAKALLKALSDSVEKYEARFGAIAPPPVPVPESMQ